MLELLSQLKNTSKFTLSQQCPDFLQSSWPGGLRESEEDVSFQFPEIPHVGVQITHSEALLSYHGQPGDCQSAVLAHSSLCSLSLSLSVRFSVGQSARWLLLNLASAGTSLESSW